ncbi:TraB/GumN family protein [Methanococcus aeolicus]|uniref:TraB family protein n=1 Tax=Methanococcus aeolicus (strain ATCC BAA-1280 / DSM 17508 / OCM 812 / Nankai-3) TaxID=419665 RepID=A6UTL0_META3|nr:TraB/GumN family protein [Methanococcus aeolicus]ABR55832.1 TraB family protein [Methanococcus aeolicus Nankai-3]UXM84060.1 TraB/GumN family protein [Methanococcus aeolicus]
MNIKINNGINECDIHLIGTAHVSEDSVDKVEKSICEINPDLIAVELDKDRFFAITKNNTNDPDNLKKVDLIKIIKEGNISLFLVHTLLANFQKDIGEKFGIKPGSEMKKAIDLAIAYNKPISLIDRPINITLKRAIQSLSSKEKLQIMLSFISGDKNIDLDEKSINEMVDNADDLIDVLKEVSPTIYGVLVDERDKYMAKNIYELSKEKERILVVVGAGHLKGIINYLKKLENNEIYINLKELTELKKNKNYLKIIISTLIVSIVVYGFWAIASDPEALKKLTIDWILINGGLSALGAIIARGKFPSVIAAFLGAPITSLIPVVGAGYIAGLVELKYRGITSDDIDELLNSNNIKNLMKNNSAMRVLMVATLSSIGSAIGTFYFIPKFLGHLF